MSRSILLMESAREDRSTSQLDKDYSTHLRHGRETQKKIDDADEVVNSKDVPSIGTKSDIVSSN